MGKTVARAVADSDPEQIIINISPEQHLEAHRLLTKCTEGELKTRLEFAYNYMLNYTADTEAVISKRKKHKQVNELAKQLRKDSNYRISWEGCLREAKKMLKDL